MKKYLSVLLAAFVFVMGMTQGSDVYADALESVAQHAKNIARFGVICSREKSFDDEIRIDGSQSLKYTDASDKLPKVKKGQYTAEVGKDKKIRVHYIFKPIPLDTVVQNINSKLQSENLKDFKVNSIHRNASVIMELTAYNKDKVLKRVKTSSKNQLDTYLDYHVPKETTHVSVNVKMSGTLTMTDSYKKSAGTHKYTNGSEMVVNLTAVDKVVPPEESEGISLIYLGGGLFVLLIGGAAFYFFGGGGGAAGAGAGIWKSATLPPEPEPPAPPPEPEYFNYKDPAGFETLYMKDPETGQWYNYQDYKEGYRVPVDMDRLQEYDAQRREDVKWNRDQMEKLENRETNFDKELKEEHRQMLEREKKLQEEARKDLYALKTNTFGLDEAERKRVLADRQEKLEAVSKAENRKAAMLDATVKTLEVVEKGADMTISVLATVTPGGNLVANIYTGVKNVAKDGMQAAADGKSVLDGMMQGAVKGGADVLQNLSGNIPAAKWGYKLAAYASTEAMKEGIVAGMQGESILKATFKGLVQGGSKFAVDQLGSMIGDKIHTGHDMPAKEAAMREKYLKIRDNWSKELKPETIKTLREMNFQRYFAKDPARVLQQGIGQTLANEAGAAAYDMGVEGKSFTESAFGDKW